MRRLIFFTLQMAFIGMVMLWFLNNPGTVKIIWLDYDIQMSAGFFLSALFISFIILNLIVKSLQSLWFIPKRLSKSFNSHRLNQAQDNLKTALVSYRNDDFEHAKESLKLGLEFKETEFFSRFLASLIAAHQKDFREQEQHLQKLIRLPQGPALAYVDLIALKINQEEPQEAFKHAKAAQPFLKGAPKLAIQVFNVFLQNELYTDAENILDQLIHKKLLPKEIENTLASKFAHACMHKALKINDLHTALRKAQKAHEIQPNLQTLKVYVELLLSQNYLKQAQKVLEKAWEPLCHPLVIDLYKRARQGDSAHTQFQYIEKMTQAIPTHPESLLAKAQAALEAQLWGIALNLLQTYENTYPPCQRYFILKAKYEQLVHHDNAAALQWLEKGTFCTPELILSCGQKSLDQDVRL